MLTEPATRESVYGARRRPTPRRLVAATLTATLAALLAFLPRWAAAEPYRPMNDEVVVERLPQTKLRETNALRAELQKNAANIIAATKLARLYVSLNRKEADPRYLGYAEAALAPWLSEVNPPSSVRLLRAVIRQRQHDFQAALTDLDEILTAAPKNPQARLTRAFLLQTMGDPRRAARDCQVLDRLAVGLAPSTCLARSESLSGQLAGAAERLTQALYEHGDEDPAVRLWSMTNLGEILHRSGDLPRAEAVFRAALDIGDPGAYLLDAYADLLLDDDRPGEVLDLLAGQRRSDGHLLRLAIAAAAVGDPSADQLAAEMSARFESSRRRGLSLHLREEARFEFHRGIRLERALELALENWANQKEPWDLRLVLETALAAGQSQKAAAAISWLKTVGLEDPAILSLAEAAVGAAS